MARKATPDLLTPSPNGATTDAAALAAMFGPVEAEEGAAQVLLSLIDPNPFQEREDYGNLTELANSIRENGLLQPPTVRPMPDGRYQSAFGHRRIAAARVAELSKIPVMVRRLSDQQMAVIAYEENDKRKDVTVIDRARAAQRMIETFGWTQQDVADRLSIGRSTVANLVRLLKLPPNLQADVAVDAVTQRQADALLPIWSWPAEMQEAAKTAPSSMQPTTLIGDARRGMSSDNLRGYVKRLQEHVTYELPEHWNNRAFDGDAYHSPKCTDCKKTHDGRCYLKACWDAKSSAWQAIEHRELIQKTGTQIAPEGLGVHGDDVKNLNSHDVALLQEAGKLPGGATPCPNLLLHKRAWSKLPGSELGYICRHTGKKQCTCLTAIARDANKESRVIWQQTRQDTSAALRIAFEQIPLHLLRILASYYTTTYDLDKLPTDRDAVTKLIVDNLIQHMYPYEPEKNGQAARDRMEKMLALGDITPPWAPNLVNVFARDGQPDEELPPADL